MCVFNRVLTVFNNFKNFILGCLLLGIGVFFNYFSRFHEIGNLSQFGPGFFPMAISFFLIFVSVLIMVFSIKWKS
jgi:hypothetical protein